MSGSLDTAGGLVVASGARFAGVGTGNVTGNMSFDGNSILEVVGINTTGALTVNGTITFGSGFGINNLTGFDWDLLTTGVGYKIFMSGQDFATSGIENWGEGNATSVGSLGRTAYFRNGSLEVVVVPEPATIALLGAGVALLGFHIARRRRID